MLHNETIVFSWIVPEFEYKEKKKDWFWLLGIGAVLLIGFGIFTKNYLFCFLVAIGSFLMVKTAHDQPEELTIEISERGIRYHKELFPYEKVFQFWIADSEKGGHILILYVNRRLSPRISFTIDPRIDPVELRNYLKEHVSESEMKEPLTEKVMRKINF